MIGMRQSTAYAMVSALILSCLGKTPSWADTWSAPTTREYRSSNGQYVAQIFPARGERRNQPPTVIVFEDEMGTLRPQWTATLSNAVSPVEAIVSGDGQFVATLDNWGRVGYGDDVVAFYCKSGQIKKYSLKEILGDQGKRRNGGRYNELFAHSISSRRWRSHSLMHFDAEGDSASFGIWLDWAAQWFVWQLRDGQQIDVAGELLKRWNGRGQSWAREQLQLPEVGGRPPYEVMQKWDKEAIAWSRRKSTRYRNKVTACRYLAYLKDPDDRTFLERALSSNEVDMNWEMVLRTQADRALAILDGMPKDFQSLRSPIDNSPTYYRLGTIELQVHLPEQPVGQGQVYVSIFPETVEPQHWRTSRPEHRTGTSLRSSSAETEHGILKFSVRPVRPGRYWVKVLWDRSGPFNYDLYYYEGMRDWRELVGTAPPAQEGDVETNTASFFQVSAGETTIVTVDCRSSAASE